MAKWDAKNLEIRTRSVEQTLVPLVTQITTLVNLKEKIKLTDSSRAILKRIGEDLQKAIGTFTEVGQAIAAENEDISADMNDACSEAIQSGDIITSLVDLKNDDLIDKAALVQVSRVLLGSITRSLLLADVIAVKKLVMSAEKVDAKLRDLEKVHVFTEFVQTFSQFGSDMVKLAYISGDRQNDLKDDKQRAEMCAARAVLEKSTMMLLTSCKTCLRHPESPLALGNRAGVFNCMRTAMSTLKEIVEDNATLPPELSRGLGMEFKDFEVVVEVAFQRPDDHEIRPEILEKMQKILIETECLIDSEFMQASRVKKIDAYCQNLHDLFDDLEEDFRSLNEGPMEAGTRRLLERITKTIDEIKTELRMLSFDMLTDIFLEQNWRQNLQRLKSSSTTGAPDLVDSYGLKIEEDCKRMHEVSKLVRNVTQSEPVVITARKIEENMKTFLPQMIAAAKILSGHPSSKISLENMEVFANIWETQVEEWTTLLKNVTHIDKRRASETSSSQKKLNKDDSGECNTL
eukprot:gene17640-19395_t